MSLSNNFPTIAPSLLLDFANTKKLDPRITFTRSTTGTYYDGKTVAKAEENLVVRSQEFETASWTKNNITTTANTTTAPDGTTTADTITPTATTNAFSFFQQFTCSDATQTHSIYVKANGYSKVMLRESNGGGKYASFDLTAVTVLASANATGAITSVGNGWYRCSIVITHTGTTRFSLYVLSNAYTTGESASFTADGTSGVFVWGAQAEGRSSLTAYTVTAADPITNYIPVLLTAAAGVPRFEHNPVTGESLGLEIEEQRTNLLQRSEEFDNASWTKSNATVTANTIVAPDGTLTGDKLVENTANGGHAIYQTVSISNATAYTFSVYAKAGERSFMSIGFDGTPSATIGINLSTGVVSRTTAGLSGTVTAVGNGWYRCSVTYTSASTVTYPLIATSVDGTYAYTGNGFAGIYIWGAQLEAGAFATSYIQTVAASATRNADSASMTGTNFSSWFNAGEGTLYAEALAPSIPSSTNFAVATVRSTSTNAIGVGLAPDTNSTANIVRTNDVAQAVFNAAMTNNQTHKLALAYAFNNSAFSNDGIAVQTDTSVILPVVDTLLIGQNRNATVAGAEFIRKIAYYPLRLTNANLQALTS